MFNINRELLDELAAIEVIIIDDSYKQQYVNTVKRIQAIYKRLAPNKHNRSDGLLEAIIDMQMNGELVTPQHKVVLRDLFAVLTTDVRIDFRNHVMFATQVKQDATVKLDIKSTLYGVDSPASNELCVLFAKYGIVGVVSVLKAVMSTSLLPNTNED